MNDKLLKKVYDEINNLKPITLYNDATGTKTDINLNGNISDYSYIEIYYYEQFWNGKIHTSKKLPSNFDYTIIGLNAGSIDSGSVYHLWAKLRNDNTKISRLSEGWGYFGSSTGARTENVDLYITKVIGYK